MARIYFNPDFCKGCHFCVQFCPKGVYQVSHKLNKKGYVIPEVVDEAACNACMMCDKACPDFALVIEKDEQEVKS